MSLILAIEPNKNQAHQLNALVRQHLKAELVTAPTAAAALAALGDRIPDVVLTPALFGLRDEAALTERLRQLGSDGSHVQTLAIPILAPAAARGANNGLLGRKKDKGSEGNNVGCDPAVFADQIKIYLQRASVERRAQASEVTARAMSTPRPSANADAPAGDDDLSSFMVGADEFDVDSLEIPSIDPPLATPPAEPARPASQPPAAPPADAQNRHGRPKQNPRQSDAADEEGLVTPPAAGPPLWRVAESIEDFYGNGDGVNLDPTVATAPHAAAPVAPAPSVINPPPPAAKPHAPSVVKSAAPAAPRQRRTPPNPNDWAYFDPSQSAFKALIRRLNEIAGNAA
jgi:hypothetical protein